MMQRKVIFLIFTIAMCTLFFASAVRADVPPPPANQQLGVDDGVFNNIVEEDCRFCHEDPDIVSGGTNLPDRHHLLVGTAIQTGECSATGTTCLADNDCNSAICSRNNVACSLDSDCPDFSLGETCGEICIGESVVPYIDSNDDGVNDTLYDCLNCHTLVWDPVTMTFQLAAFRDCTLCHIQIPGEGSVHHLLPVAQGGDSPLGDPDVGDCTPCHGSLVDDIGDGHTIPTYNPSLVTPSPSGGDGLPGNGRFYCSRSGDACVTAVDCLAGTCDGGDPCNVDGDCPLTETCTDGSGVEETCDAVFAGGCNYCHDSGTDFVTGVQVFANDETHHNTGVFRSETGVIDFDVCQWCHNMSLPEEEAIRTCEGCHGFESLHNIQIDSPAIPTGDILPNEEDPYYGHIGHNDDCWGCHGFFQATAPGTGPVTPFIKRADVLSMTTGTDTVVTLTGKAFTNRISTIELTSDVVMTAADGSSVTLIPSSITSKKLVVTIPGTTAPGNYALRAVKGPAQSNPVVISVKPAVAITNSSCNKKKGVLTINGAGFSQKIPGTDDYISVEVNGQPVNTISWSDTQITASVSSCPGNAVITVKTLYGTTASGSGGGKPDKPCKGKKCKR